MLVCTKANLCHKNIEATFKNIRCLVVVSMYISPFFKHSSKLKELELLLNDISNLIGSPVSFAGDMIIGRLKQNNLSGK